MLVPLERMFVKIVSQYLAQDQSPFGRASTFGTRVKPRLHIPGHVSTFGTHACADSELISRSRPNFFGRASTFGTHESPGVTHLAMLVPLERM